MKRTLEYLFACLGTATIAALAFFELSKPHVAFGYSIIVLATLTVAWLLDLEIFLYQALIMTGVTAFRLAMNNFQNLHGPLKTDLWGSVWAIVALAVGVPIAFRLRAREAKAEEAPGLLSFVTRHPEQPMFFVPLVLMAVLLFIRMPSGAVTLAWGVEGLVVFVLALIARERSFRLSGLAILLLCVAKIVVWDLWFEPGWSNKGLRVVTLIAVGVILLVVPYLYGRNREAFKEFL